MASAQTFRICAATAQLKCWRELSNVSSAASRAPSKLSKEGKDGKEGKEGKEDRYVCNDQHSHQRTQHQRRSSRRDEVLVELTPAAWKKIETDLSRDRPQ